MQGNVGSIHVKDQLFKGCRVALDELFNQHAMQGCYLMGGGVILQAA